MCEICMVCICACKMCMSELVSCVLLSHCSSLKVTNWNIFHCDSSCRRELACSASSKHRNKADVTLTKTFVRQRVMNNRETKLKVLHWRIIKAHCSTTRLPKQSLSVNTYIKYSRFWFPVSWIYKDAPPNKNNESIYYWIFFLLLLFSYSISGCLTHTHQMHMLCSDIWMKQ